MNEKVKLFCSKQKSQREKHCDINMQHVATCKCIPFFDLFSFEFSHVTASSSQCII